MLQQVLQKVQQGWGDKCPDLGLQPFYIRRDELSTHNGCILWRNREVVPARGQQQLLEDLHTAHPGIVKMKNLAQSYLWWPGLDGDIDEKVKTCKVCQLQSATPATAPLHPVKNKSVELPFVTKNSSISFRLFKHFMGASSDDTSALIEFTPL